jgi:lipid A 3-O-deacylase
MAFPEMNWRIIFITIFGVVVSAMPLLEVRAVDESQGPIFAITEENDLFSNPLTADHTDRHYTQGLKMTYRDGDNELPQWVVKASGALPPLWMNTRAQNVGYVFGQNIYTPQDIQTNVQINTDRPYGGWLYGGMFLQRRGDMGDARIPALESFEVDLGVTGPASLAGTTQVNFHHWFLASDVPRGWHNQLDNEPGLLLKYERLWRLSPNEQTARYVDLIPHIGAEVGNIMVSGDLGATLRVGVNLPDDFGVQIIDAPASLIGGATLHSSPFSCYAFGGVDGRAVGQNLFLDGNTLRDGPNVERIPWVADFSCGVALSLFRHLELSYTRVVRTHEFVGQKNADVFGSLTAKAMFRF